jgi:hypothetical protein
MEIALRAEMSRGDTIEVLLGAVGSERNPFTGARIYRRLDSARVERMPDYGSFAAKEVIDAPAAYLLPDSLSRIVERLEAHGVLLARLDSDAELAVAAFRIDSTRTGEREYQGHRMREAWGEWSADERLLEAGTVVVPVRQPLGRLVAVLLEPRSDDGFLAWNLLDAALEEGTEYPIVRVDSLPEGCGECAAFR